MDVKRIGAFIKELRKEKNMTQEDLADALFVSGKTVSRWETGSTLPDLITLQSIAEYFGVDIRELIDGKRYPEKKEAEETSAETDGVASPAEDTEKETVRKMAEYSDKKEKRNSRRKWFISLLILLGVLASAALFFMKKCNDDLDRVRSVTFTGEVTHYETKRNGDLELCLLSEETQIVRVLVTEDTQMTDILKLRIQAKQRGLILQAQAIYTERELRASGKYGLDHAYRTEALYLVSEQTVPYDPESGLRKPLLELREGYTVSQAERDGCVVVDGGTLLHGEIRLAEFVKRAAEGIPSLIRVYNAFRATSSGMAYCLKELEYTGSAYILTYYDQTGDTHEWFLSQKSYQYLKEETFVRYERTTKAYLLTDDLTATFEGWLKRIVSSYYPLPSDAAYENFEVFLSYDISQPLNQGRPVYGIESASLEENGPIMRCVLGHGQTSGIFTYTLEVYGEKEGLLASRVFRSEWMDLSLVLEDEHLPNADGSFTARTKVRVKGVRHDGKTILYDIVLKDGQLDLLEIPWQPKEGQVYGNITLEDAAIVKELALDHMYKTLTDSEFPIEWSSSQDNEASVTVLDPLAWGDYSEGGGGTAWMVYAEKYGVQDHPDRIALVVIYPKISPVYSVTLVKPLETDVWTIVNYGF